MASSQEARTAKIKNVLCAISDNHWTSVTDFLLAFYASSDPEIHTKAARSLAYVNGRRFAQEALLEAWEEATPSKSKVHLRRVLAEKVGSFIIEESTAAIRNDSLHLPSQKLSIPFLTTEFALQPFASLFQTVLPCLWIILYMVITAPNDYERKRGVEKAEKGDAATRVVAVQSSPAVVPRSATV
ncbi:hypothetical protein PsYK624_049420 [Phanerochaete sordida]|uniref:Uncharacterized protein n=1 Tax=Phanerochaete sordida TaxID=48140 RepID=A0A9P3LB46_9APHY|nr:hypothetical protein PsYK624_049420 [Phanerochaete sordida]